jgi:prepilin-type N-terminal cleavage/methylation domain-containing protein
MLKFTNRSPGFTLIEALVTIAIISLLGALALPKFVISVKAAKIARLTGDCQAIETAARLYNSDTGEWPRIRGTAYTNMEGFLKAYGTGLTGWYGPYLKAWPKSPFWKGAAESAYNYQLDYKRINSVKYLVVELSFANYPDYSAKILELDKFIDKSNGMSAGKIRWTTNSRLVNWIIQQDPANVKNANGALISI